MILNERNEKTKKVIHLMVTSLCNRNCAYCCNKQYDLQDIPYVTDEELKEAETLCITGGEPFLFTRPDKIASYYKHRYPNIKNVYVYTNATEFIDYIITYPYEKLKNIDGLTVSIKDERDLSHIFKASKGFYNITLENILKDKNRSNILYYFEERFNPGEIENFRVIKREWQEDFKPADDSIFRKV